MNSNKQLMIWLLGIGGILGILSWFIVGAAKNWVGGISLLALAGGLAVLLTGTIAKRRELKGAHKIGK